MEEEKIMSKKAKMASILMCIVLMAGSLFVGCGSGSQKPEESSSKADPAAQSEQSESAAKAESVTIKLAIAAAVGQPIEVACQQFSKDVEEKSGGRIKVEVFPGGVLGNETTTRDMVSEGSIQMCNIGSGTLGASVPAANIASVYYVWKDRDTMMNVLTGPVGDEMFYKPFEENANIKVINGWPQAPRQLLTTKPVTQLSDLKGIKIRVPAGAPIFEDLWSSLGAMPVSLGLDEAYTALQQGVVDAIEMPVDFMYNYRFQEVAKNLVMTNHLHYVNYLMINADFYNNLSADDQKILTDCAADAEALSTKLLNESVDEIVEKMKAEGVTATEVDEAPFAQAVQPVYEKWEKNWGPGVYEKIMDAQK
jgi:tripartite ATP-independent transporter DctP family solute receptor